MDLTKNQEQAVQIDKENSLVSAAAGSGKTAVLTKRVVRLLTEAEEPAGVDEILVSTFTKLSAGEMIHRIGNLLNEKIDGLKTEIGAEKDKDKLEALRIEIEKYELKKLQLPNAKISTIDSICKILVEENFQSLDISSSTKIADTKQIQLLEKEVAILLLEDIHTGTCDTVNLDDLKDLVEFTCTKNDSNLIEMLLSIHSYIRYFPHPIDYLNKVIGIYKNELDNIAKAEEEGEEPNPLGSFFIQPILNDIRDSIGYCALFAKANLNIISKCRVLKECYKPAFEDDYNGLLEIENEFVKLENLRNGTNDEKEINELIQSIFDQISAKTWKRLGSPSKEDKPDIKPNVEKLCKAERQKLKDSIKKLLDKYEFALDKDYYKNDTEISHKHITTLFEIIKVLYKNIELEKRTQEIMDFPNVEHYTIDLLTKKNEDGSYNKSETALALSKQFQYILVDECQDINRVQNEIFNLLSDNQENIFMVGDVKQSIYKFRKAAPEIFIEKSESDDVKTILLQENFRSRDVVCHTINHIFSQIMSKEIGDIEYNHNEYLKVGRQDYIPYPNQTPELYNSNPAPELHIIDLVENENADEQDVIEAKHITQTIKKMKDEGYEVYDGDGKTRKCEYRDFTILVRTKNEFKQVYQKEFDALGMPIICNFDTQFLKEYEILIAINLLKVITNPLQDVPLLSVMMSPLFGFPPDLVSLLKLNNGGKLWNALISFYKDDNSNSLDLKLEDGLKESYIQTCKNFHNLMLVFREKASRLTVSKLLQFILNSTDFIALMSSKKDMTIIQDNINFLLDYAKTYDNFNGLPGFISHINRLTDNEIGIKKDNEISNTANAVKLITIHGSKGLEFPICFLADCARNLNEKDIQKSYVLDTEYGLGLKILTNQKQKKYKSLPFTSISLKRTKDYISEELRILYVALTRAKEKLIMVGSYKKANEEISKTLNFFETQPDTLKQPIKPYLVSKQAKYSDWLISSLLKDVELPNADTTQKVMIDKSFDIKTKDFKIDEETNDFIIDDSTGEIDFEIKTSEVNFKLLNSTLIKAESDTEENDKDTEEAKLVEIDTNLANKIKTQIAYKYPHIELTKTPAKTTVTNIAKEEYAKDKDNFTKLESNLIFDEELVESEFTPAQKGTILHAFMQYANYDEASKPGNLETEITRLVQDCYITESEANTLDRNKIENFFTSDTFAMMQDKANTVKREFKFYYEIDANRVNNKLAENEGSVFLQAIADCLVFKDDVIVIIDYKTNRTTDENELIEQYKVQMELYSKAISEMFNMPTEAYLYSLTLNKAIKVDVEIEV